MLGSHDSYTFQKAQFPLNAAKRWWKTQCKTIEEQYAFGVRLFDIRVYRDGPVWRTCHGIANFDRIFHTISEIIMYFRYNFPQALIRIYLEKGDDTEFKNSVSKFVQYGFNMDNVWRIGIKEDNDWTYGLFNNNTKLFDAGYKFALDAPWENNSHELHCFIDSHNFLTANLRAEAKRINHLHVFTSERQKEQIIKSKENLWLIDFATNEY